MIHQEQHEEQLELGIPYETVLKKKNYLKNLLATSSFEIVLLLFYLEYEYSIQNLKAT